MINARGDELLIVVGLGNPGKEYRDTRHNIGFNTIDLLAKNNGIKINKIKFNSVYGEGRIGGRKLILVKPQTYMNNSGISVLAWYNFYKLPVENILVIVDDIDIDFGTIRIRKSGSAGSHNGLKSIIKSLGTQDVPRIKIGVGDKKEGQDLASFVLSRFAKNQKKEIQAALEKATRATESIIKYDIDRAMNDFN